MLPYNVKNHDLYIDNTNMVDLAKKFGTPLYVISYTELKKRINEFQQAFLHKYENVAIRYAAKANLNSGMVQIMKKAGFGLDVVSGGEVFIAKQAGADMATVEFNGNNKTAQEIAEAMDAGVGYFVCDNVTELEMLQNIAADKGIVQKVLFRVTPDVSGGAHAYINTGQLDSKFGITLAEGIFMDVLERAFQLKNIDVQGIHFHVGSQLHANDVYLKALDVVKHLLAEIKQRFDFEIKILNIGGGFGIWYTEADVPPNLRYYFEPIMEKIETDFQDLGYAARPMIVTEPGRYLIGESGCTLYTLGSISDIPNVRKYIGIDGGMTDNIRPALYQAVYSAIIANKADEETKELVTIAGNCCESGDILMKDVMLPKIESGDILTVFSTGAYNASMASNYNKNLIPATVLIENGIVQEMVKRQSYEQLIENDCEIEI